MNLEIEPALTSESFGQDAQRPTILQVLHSLNIGGAEMLAARMGLCMNSQFRFVYACLDDLGPLGKQLQAEGHRVEFLRRQPGLDFRCIKRLATLAEEEHVDVLHAHQYTPFSYALLSRVWRHHRPVLFTEHGRWFPDMPRRKRIWFNRFMLRKDDRVMGVGESVRQALIQNEGLPENRVGVIYNGVNLKKFSADSRVDRTAIRQEIDCTDNDFVIIQVARLDALKDHPTAIRTLKHVTEKYPQAKLVLVGEGPQEDLIRSQIAEYGLGDHVRLLGTRHDVSRLISAADLFLLTSVSEGIPLTLIEAMAMQLPVVSTDVGGVREIVLPAQTGMLAASGEDQQLAAAIVQLIEQPAKRQEMGQAGLARAEEIFSEQQMHESYARLYREMLRD